MKLAKFLIHNSDEKYSQRDVNSISLFQSRLDVNVTGRRLKISIIFSKLFLCQYASSEIHRAFHATLSPHPVIAKFTYMQQATSEEGNY